MQDPKQMMDDLFAMKVVSGEFDKKKDGNETGSGNSPSSGGHYPSSGGNGGRKQTSGGCLSALILLPVMPLVSLFRNLFSGEAGNEKQPGRCCSGRKGKLDYCSGSRDSFRRTNFSSGKRITA